MPGYSRYSSPIRLLFLPHLPRRKPSLVLFEYCGWMCPPILSLLNYIGFKDYKPNHMVFTLIHDGKFNKFLKEFESCQGLEFSVELPND